MSRLTPYKGLLLNLEQKIEPGRRKYLTKEAACQRLRELTAQDFGFDVAAWRQWLDEQGLK